MATQADLDRAAAWARAQVGKPYVLGAFGSAFDCSSFMSGIATMIRDGEAKRWFTTHPFHGGAWSPLPGWERDLTAPFMIGIDASGIGHTGGTLQGVNFEATSDGGRQVRMGLSARGANHSMYRYRYGFRPSLLVPGSVSSYPFVINNSTPDARPLQRELKRTGFMPQSVVESPNYGPATQEAVAKFHDAHPQYKSEGVSHDPQIGNQGWAFLKSLPSKTAPAPTPVASPSDPYTDGLPRVDQTSPSAKALQAELKRVGYMPKSIEAADNYGPATQRAVAEFHNHNPKYRSEGVSHDPQIGRQGWAHLRAMAAGTGRLPAATPSSPASGAVASPVPGYRVTTPYGVRGAWAAGYHTGDDYAAPTGTPVVAVTAGVIAVSSGASAVYGSAYGQIIVLRGDNGRDYMYCHLSARNVAAGVRVRPGQAIGRVGTTGRSTGPHLHFEDRPRGGGYGSSRKPKW